MNYVYIIHLLFLYLIVICGLKITTENVQQDVYCKIVYSKMLKKIFLKNLFKMDTN